MVRGVARSDGGPAAIDWKHGPGDERRLVAGQEQDGEGDLPGQADPAQGSLADLALVDLAPRLGGDPRGDRSGADGVDADVVRGVVVGEGDTYEEALADVTSAIRFHIESFGPSAI